MTTPIIERSRSFNAVAAGQTATIDLPTTRIYRGLRLLYGTGTAGGPTRANMEAEVTEIRIKVNGKVQRRFSAAQLFAINAYHGKAVEDGILPIFFAEPWRRTVQGEDGLAWGMADVDTFQVEVDIAAGATNPTLDADAITLEGNLAMGPITKWRQFVVPVSAVGIVNVSTLPKTDAYFTIHCVSANITSVKVLVDRKEIVNAGAAVLQSLADDQGFAWQTGYFHLDFSNSRRVTNVLQMTVPGAGRVSDYQIDFDMAVAANFTMLTEVVGLRD